MNLLAPIFVLFSLLQIAQPPATFTGVFRGIESGHIILEVGKDQDLRLFVTGSTKYFREGKRSKESAFHNGDPITVDAERDARMNMVALRVEAVKPKTAKPAGSAPASPGKPN